LILSLVFILITEMLLFFFLRISFSLLVSVRAEFRQLASGGGCPSPVSAWVKHHVTCTEQGQYGLCPPQVNLAWNTLQRLDTWQFYVITPDALGVGRAGKVKRSAMISIAEMMIILIIITKSVGYLV